VICILLYGPTGKHMDTWNTFQRYFYMEVHPLTHNLEWNKNAC
jgi:hypothetical protein